MVLSCTATPTLASLLVSNYKPPSATYYSKGTPKGPWLMKQTSSCAVLGKLVPLMADSAKINAAELHICNRLCEAPCSWLAEPSGSPVADSNSLHFVAKQIKLTHPHGTPLVASPLLC